MSGAIMITPYLIVRGAAEAISFYEQALGAEESFRMIDPANGRIGHAELRIGGGSIMLADEYRDFGAVSPDTLGGSPVNLHIATLDVDADVKRAKAAGAVVLRPVTDQSFGERNAHILDPFGHRWILSQTIEAVSPEVMQQRWNEETGA